MIETNIIVKYYFLQHSWKKVRTVAFQSPYDELVAMGLSFNNKADNYKISLSKDLRTIEKSITGRKPNIMSNCCMRRSMDCFCFTKIIGICQWIGQVILKYVSFPIQTKKM